MSDGTQGEGWWQAADGKWYPPEQHPDFQPGATQPVESVPPPPTAAMPPVGPASPPPGPPPGAPTAGSSNAKWIVGGVLAVAAVAIAAFLLLGGDDDKKNVAATSASSSSSRSSSSSSSRSSSSSSRSSSSSSSSALPQGQPRMLTAAEVGPGFADEPFVPDSTTPNPCGAPNASQTFPPVIDIGSQASNGVAFFQEEALTYTSAADAEKVFDIITEETTCPNPTLAANNPVVFSPARDVSSSLTTPVETAVEIDFEATFDGVPAQGQVFVIKDGVAIVIFQFIAPKSVDSSTLPDAISIVNKGLDKIVNG